MIPSDKRTSKVIIWGMVLVTVLLYSGANDPFNSPKFWVLSLFAAWLAGPVISQSKNLIHRGQHTFVLALTSFFTLANLLAFFSTDNKFVGFFGAYQRRTGLLTYLDLTLFLLAAALFFSLAAIKYFEYAVLILSTFFSFYGLLQRANQDPIHWNNPYNSILLTLGNPDFAAAVLAILATVLVGVALNAKRHVGLRVYSAFIAAMLVLLIASTHAIQGLLALAVGVLIIVFVMTFFWSKKTGFLLLGLSILGAPVAILGMLSHGPLSFLHKQSVVARGNYFRAAWHMFKSHPFTGVGLDRFGANFRQFRDLKQVSMSGPNLVSNNAHDVPLQLLATGGILLFISYLVLVAYIGFRGFHAIKNANSDSRMAITSVVAAWATFQSQSVISIDNIGIAIWGWALGGMVIALSLKREEVTLTVPKKKQQISSSKDLGASLISAGVMLPVLLLSISMYLGENSMYLAMRYQKPNDPKIIELYKQAIRKPLAYPPVEPTFRPRVASLIASVDDNEAVSLLIQSSDSDKRDFDARDILAQVYEQTQHLGDAVKVREEMAILDPYNYFNKIALAKDAVNIGDIATGKKFAADVLTFVPKSDEKTAAQVIMNIK